MCVYKYVWYELLLYMAINYFWMDYKKKERAEREQFICLPFQTYPQMKGKGPLF